MATTKLNQNQLNDYNFNNSLSRQAIINGNFDVAQRGVSFTIPATGTTQTPYHLDHWRTVLDANGGTMPGFVISRQLITSGAIPNAFYNLRIAVDGAGTSLGNDSAATISQYIEHATRNLCGDGKKVTLSFWAKSDIANKKLGVFAQQVYGSGGSPSAGEIINGSTWTLTSTWTRYTYTFTTNTLASKTFGTANDDYLRVYFQIQWGSSAAARIGTTGAETYVGAGNIDIAQVQLCAGDVALPFMPKSKTTEEDDCVHFYRIGQLLGIANTTSILAIASDFATKLLRTGVTTSNFKIYTTRANAIAEVAQQALTTPGVGDTNITQSSYIVNEVNGVIGLQLSGTPLTAGRAYSGYYVINQEL